MDEQLQNSSASLTPNSDPMVPAKIATDIIPATSPVAEPTKTEPEKIAGTPVANNISTPINEQTKTKEIVFEKTEPVILPDAPTDTIGQTGSDPIAEKLERAKLAMEGPERTAAREEREHNEDISKKLADINSKLTELNKKKEVFELNWIKLDSNRTGLRAMIKPISEREATLEAEESQLEEQEKNTVGSRERMTLEQKRWALQEQRHQAEEEKWVYENRLLKIEDEVKTNTAEYQKLLDEEEILLKEKDSLNQTI